MERFGVVAASIPCGAVRKGTQMTAASIGSSGLKSVIQDHMTSKSDRSDEERLYARHLTDATQFAFLLTGSPQRADDIAQEAILRCLKKAKHLHDPVRFSHYVRRAVVRGFLDDQRADNRRRIREDTYAGQLSRESRSADPAADASDSELLAAVLHLPPKQRAVVVLRFWEDLTLREVATTLNTPVGTVKSRLSRGLNRIEEYLDEQRRFART